MGRCVFAGTGHQRYTNSSTVRWGDLTSFNFCFDGIEKGSIVAVSTIGIKKEKSHFILGYNEMLSRIKPNKIICYGKPFDEMKGDIIEVDYGETNNLSKGFFVKKTYITELMPLHKGGGSASGQSSGNPNPTENNGIIDNPFDNLPEHVRYSYKKYEESGWKGARKDQSKKLKAEVNLKIFLLNCPQKILMAKKSIIENLM